MAILEALSEEEKYLYALLQDPSGLDLAEFCFVDERNKEDRCFRAWPFQWVMWRDPSPLQIDLSGRSIGKTMGITIRAFAFPFLHPGQESLLTAPQLVHLDLLTKNIEQRFKDVRLGREMLPKGRSAVTHHPFHMTFLNGSRIIGRIPHDDGKAIKGCVSEGTLILTATGYKPVEDLEVGELVMTHTGEWKPVLFIEEDENDCYEVRGIGSHPITVSCDHLFYGVENSAGPKQRRSFSEPVFVQTEKLLEFNTYWATPMQFDSLPLPPLEYNGTAIKLDTDHRSFWWLVGRWLADGYLSMSPKTGKERRVCWTPNPASNEEIRKCIEDIGGRMGKKGRDHSSSDVLSLCSAPLYRWLLENFGQHATHKRLPGFVLGLPPEFRWAVLDGYLAGDGCATDKRPRIAASSASQPLILGIQMLAQSLGMGVSCSGIQPKVTEICGAKLKKKPAYAWRIQITANGHGGEIGNVRVGKVKFVTPVGKRRVFNPIVEDNHTYISNSIVSHNTHPLTLEVDEAQNYPPDAWDELTETLQRGQAGASWRCHGVSMGVHGKYWQMTQETPDNDFKVLKFTAIHRPTWNDQERREKINLYGSKDDPGWQRNILGRHSESSSSLFVQSRLMRCASPETSEHTQSVYQKYNLKFELIKDLAGTDGEAQIQYVLGQLDFPLSHKQYKTFWCGMDVGVTVAPSEIVVAAEYFPSAAELKKDQAIPISTPAGGLSRIKVLTRIRLIRIPIHVQASVVSHVIKFYQPQGFGLDKGGIGQGLFGLLQAESVHIAKCIKGYDFGAKEIVGIDETIELAPGEEPIKDAAMNANVLERSTDILREWVDNGRLQLPWDSEAISQFLGQTFTLAKTGIDQYGRRRRVYSKGEVHFLDACKMMAMAQSQQEIEHYVEEQKTKKQVPVFDYFG